MQFFGSSFSSTSSAFLLPLLVSFSSTIAVVLGEADGQLSWVVLDDAVLPTPLSDNTATYIGKDDNAGGNSRTGDMIYIAGGCNSPQGNTHRDSTGLELDFFLCESISDALYGFQPANEDNGESNLVITELATMPRPRYRHAAVRADGKLWLIGGRTIPDDTIIAEIDVYDPATDVWSTVGTIPEEYLASDNGAFTNAEQSEIYVVGGYNQNYYEPEALATTFSFNIRETFGKFLMENNNMMENFEQTIQVTKRANLNQQRGDMHAVASYDGTTAYVAGGYASYPCQPLTTVEVYDIEKDVWEYVPSDLLSARGDQAMVHANNQIYAIGGEVNHPDQCAAPELLPILSVQSQAVNDVEMFDTTLLGTSELADTWTDIVDIPDFRFRFSAASYPMDDATEQVYVFGGQTTFDDDCKCYPTTNEITTIVRTSTLTNNKNDMNNDGMYEKEESNDTATTGSKDDSSSSSNRSSFITIIAGAIMMTVIVM